MLKHCKVSWNHTYRIPFGKDIFLKQYRSERKGPPSLKGPFLAFFFTVGRVPPWVTLFVVFFHKPLLPSMLELVEDSLDLR